jgi:hypothetical protein
MLHSSKKPGEDIHKTWIFYWRDFLDRQHNMSSKNTWPIRLGDDEFRLDKVNIKVPIPNPIPFPFKTKRALPEIPRTRPIQNSYLSTLKKYQRPYFSPKFHSWEMDYFLSSKITTTFGENNDKTVVYRYYLIFININTKFIKVYPLNFNIDPTIRITLYCLKDMMKRYKINNLRFDNDRLFVGEVNDFCNENGITTYFSKSKYINENRVVDRAIRTIKDGAGLGLDKRYLLYPSVVLKIVEYYNNTPHSAYKNKFTPYQVQNDLELEAWYIREQQLRLFDSLKLQQKSFQRYQPGDVLLIHRPLGKTTELFRKRRRNFDELALFEEYDHGNVKVRLWKTQRYAIIPIYYTKFICHGVDLPARYRALN